MRSWLPGAALCLSMTALNAAQDGAYAYRLPNGLQLRLQEDHQRPLVRVELRIQWDSAEVPMGHEGVDGLLQRMLGASLADSADSGLRFRVDGRDLVWSGLSTSYDQNAIFRALALGVIHPRLDEATFTSLKRDLSQEISPVRNQALARFLLGIGDPDGCAKPTPTSLARLERPELEGFRRRVLRPEHAVLSIHGDLNPEQARQMAATEFGAWGPGPEAPLAAISEPQPPPEELLIFMGEAGQPEVRVASPRVGSQGPRERAAGMLLDLGFRSGWFRPAMPAGLEIQTRPAGPWMFTLGGTGGKLEDRVESLRLCLARLIRWEWNSDDVRNLRGLWNAERAAEGLHPDLQVARRSLRLRDEEAESILPQLKTEDLRREMTSRLESSVLHWLVLGASPEEASRLKASSRVVKVMPEPQSVAPDPGSAPARH